MSILVVLCNLFSSVASQGAQRNSSDVSSSSWPVPRFGSIQSISVGKCLDLPGGKAVNGAKLQTWDCNGQTNQLWGFSEGQIKYLGDVSKCVDNPNPPGQLQLWDCNGQKNQQWGYDTSEYTIYLNDGQTDASRCVDLSGNSADNGAQVVIWNCNGHTNQQWSAAPQGGKTSVTDKFNKAIERSGSGVYRGGGKGMLVRNPFDNYETSDRNVVPCSFLHNDIWAPTSIFPTGWNGMLGNGSPNCPNDGSNGFYKEAHKCTKDQRTGDTGPWNYATAAYAIVDGMNELFQDFDDIQSDSWGYGVFYPTDSNSVDGRCRYLADYNGYDCPGGFIDSTGKYTKDGQGTGVHRGAGYYKMGNPTVNGNLGGGAGCHFDGYSVLDQTNNKQGGNTVSDHHCQCNYDFKSTSWAGWVRAWSQYGFNVKKDDGWFAGGSKKGPAHALDQGSCWVNNPADMIKMQNQFYWQKQWWSNQKAPQTKWDNGDVYSLRAYWGWNEVPLDMAAARNLQLREAVVIKLPAAICNGGAGGDDTIACLGYGQQQNLESDLDLYVGNHLLIPGYDNAGKRPGSYTVFLREYVGYAGVGNPPTYINWQRYFFCENWLSPTKKYAIRYKPIDATDDYGACYIDWGGGHLRDASSNAPPAHAVFI